MLKVQTMQKSFVKNLSASDRSMANAAGYDLDKICSSTKLPAVSAEQSNTMKKPVVVPRATVSSYKPVAPA